MQKQEAADLYYGKDKFNWTVMINKKDFKQDFCQPSGLQTMMFRARGFIKTNPKIIPLVLCNMNIRKQWESQLYDMYSFDASEDNTYQKTFYVFRSPFGVAHREFLLLMKQFDNYPEPGMTTLYMKSIEDDRV